MVTYLDPGPASTCAPGHESMEDFSIIRSYRLKSGVMDFQKVTNEDHGIWAWGTFARQHSSKKGLIV